MASILPPILAQAHDLVRRVLRPGDLAVDATVGNGQDTLFLADCVGPTGRVIGFDIQTSALEATASRMRAANLESRVELVHRGHEEMSAWFDQAVPLLHPKAVMFNLGYQPGGDQSVITRPETSVIALRDALDLVEAGGVLTAVIYPGHQGGRAEAEGILAWARSIPAYRAQAVCHQVLNTRTPAPFLLAVAKKNRPSLPPARDLGCLN